MKLFPPVAMLLIISATANAVPVETWKCWDQFDRSESILVTATVEPDRQKGEIAVAGVMHTTVFQVAGFSRRWDFGLSNKRYQYSFIIEPNGEGKYFDYGNEGNAAPNYFMKCRESGAAVASETAEAQRPVTEQITTAQARLIADYRESIKAKIQRLIVLPPNIRGNPEASFDIVLRPDGNPLSVKLKRSSGNPAYDNAVERAILKAQPLPLPPDQVLFRYFRELNLMFSAQ